MEDVRDDFEFAEKLLREENVLVLPGRFFKCENYFRIVVTPPLEVELNLPLFFLFFF
jgi:aspartate/methionine/tyrosine aminotransferase